MNQGFPFYIDLTVAMVTSNGRQYRLEYNKESFWTKNWWLNKRFARFRYQHSLIPERYFNILDILLIFILYSNIVFVIA